MIHLLSASIDKVGFTVRIENCLKIENIKTLEELVRCTKEKLSKFENLGRKSLRDIQYVLKELHLKLGMTDQDIEKYNANLLYLFNLDLKKSIEENSKEIDEVKASLHKTDNTLSITHNQYSIIESTVKKTFSQLIELERLVKQLIKEKEDIYLSLAQISRINSECDQIIGDTEFSAIAIKNISDNFKPITWAHVVLLMPIEIYVLESTLGDKRAPMSEMCKVLQTGFNEVHTIRIRALDKLGVLP